jgi:hypothetical protein
MKIYIVASWVMAPLYSLLRENGRYEEYAAAICRIEFYSEIDTRYHS